MAKCKYILKLPGGESLELPVGFNALINDSKINKAFSEYIIESNEKKKVKKLNEIVQLVSDKTKLDKPKEIIEINNIVSLSTTEESLYDNLNT